MTIEGVLRGKASEDNFFAVCSDMKEANLFPNWLHGFRKATKLEDSLGIDAWAETDVGDLPLQIKSNWHLVIRHRRRQNRRHIPCVIAFVGRAPEQIFDNALVAISVQRNKILQKDFGLNHLTTTRL